MPRYKRLKKVNHKKEKSNKKRAVKDDIDAKKKKEGINDYEIKKLLWELRGGKLRYGRAAGRAPGSSWIAVQNKSEELRNQKRNAELLAKKQAREAADVTQQYETYRTNVGLEKSVGLQNDINSMKEKNKAMEYKLQQQRGTSASGKELMDEISEEYTDVKKKSDLMNEIVKREQNICKMNKSVLEGRKKLIELSGGNDVLPKVIDDDYVKEQQTAYNEAIETQKNVTEALNARKKAIDKYDKEAKRIGIPDDSDFYKSKDLHEKKSMMGEYLVQQNETLQKMGEELNDFKGSYANIKKTRESKQKSINDLSNQFTELYPDNGKYVGDVIKDDRYTFEEKMSRLFDLEENHALDVAKTATLYGAAVVVGKHNKQDGEHAAKLNDLVGRLQEEAVNDKRYRVEKEKYLSKSGVGFKREVKEIMQQVNPLYDSVNIDPQYRATDADAVAVLKSINKEASKLRDEDESVE